MKSYDSGDLALAFVAGGFITFAFIAFFAFTKTDIRKQAIERGHAEYVVDSDGKTTWQWKEVTP